MEEINAIHGKRDSIYIISYMLRLGSINFMTRLEYEHYPPDTSLNDLYTLFHLKYNDALHYVIEIPKTGFEKADALAKECGLKLVPGKPFSPDYEQFAIKSDSCFTLEMNKDTSYNIDMEDNIYKGLLLNEINSALEH